MRNLVYAVLLFGLLGCASNFLEYEKEDKFFKNEEFDRTVKIQTEADEKDAPSAEPTPQVTTPAGSMAISGTVTISATATTQVSPKKETAKAKPKKAATVKEAKSSAPTKRQPDIEDNEGFIEGSRRPQKDPFRVGEKVVHAVKYFTAEAGKLYLQVKPFAQVNGRKAYHFSVSLQSSRIFSNFYSVDDRVDTFLDYETLMPHVLKVNIKETGKLSQKQSYFDEQSLKANYWEKTYTEKHGEEEKKYSWDILPYSQNAFSGLFYMRVFNWKVGKEISFRVAEDKKNIVFTGTAIAKETLETEAGTFQAIKVKASIVTRGALTQTGDIFIWISDDDNKYLLRIEAKIKIGTLVSEVVEIDKGH